MNRRSTARQGFGGSTDASVSRQSGGTGPRQAAPDWEAQNSAQGYVDFVAMNREAFLAERLPGESGPEWLDRTNRGGRYL